MSHDTNTTTDTTVTQQSQQRQQESEKVNWFSTGRCFNKVDQQYDVSCVSSSAAVLQLPSPPSSQYGDNTTI